jgi:histidinol-phosphate/aromatic aminotransferase/cobyric acid decarboxylase-like protein
MRTGRLTGLGGRRGKSVVVGGEADGASTWVAKRERHHARYAQTGRVHVRGSMKVIAIGTFGLLSTVYRVTISYNTMWPVATLPSSKFTCAQYCTQIRLLHLQVSEQLTGLHPNYGRSMHPSILVCSPVNPTGGRILSNSLTAWG